MDTGWQRYLDLAAGLGEATRKSAEAIVKRLVSSGEVAADRAESYVEELLRSSERNRKALTSMVRSEAERTVARLGLARQADLDDLRRRVAALEDAAGLERHELVGGPVDERAPAEEEATAEEPSEEPPAQEDRP